VLESLLICTRFYKAFALCSKHTELAWQSSRCAGHLSCCCMPWQLQSQTAAGHCNSSRMASQKVPAFSYFLSVADCLHMLILT
jgi:hypothetical protein